MTTSLYAIAHEYRQACDVLADLDLDAQTVAYTLESLSGDLEHKAVNVAAFLRGLEATAANIKEAEAGMKKRREAMERRAESLREYLLGAMQHTGIRKISSTIFDLAIRAKPVSVEIEDAAQIPADLMRTPEPKPAEPDKKAIAAAIKAGRDVQGARLVGGERLHIA
jgi:hypothetical protein